MNMRPQNTDLRKKIPVENRKKTKGYNIMKVEEIFKSGTPCIFKWRVSKISPIIFK